MGTRFEPIQEGSRAALFFMSVRAVTHGESNGAAIAVTGGGGGGRGGGEGGSGNESKPTAAGQH